MIQAYSQTHNGQTPSSQLVRSIILSNTTDLHDPVVRAGRRQARRAGRRAGRDVGQHAQPTGTGRLISPNQLDFAQQPGTGETATVRVTNVGRNPETYTPSLRTLGAKLSDIKADIDVTPGQRSDVPGLQGRARRATRR